MGAGHRPSDPIPARALPSVGQVSNLLLALGVADPQAFRLEFERVVKDAQAWLASLHALQRDCLRTRKNWSEHDEVLYLALRRGLLVGEAQARWLSEVDAYLRNRKISS